MHRQSRALPALAAWVLALSPLAAVAEPDDADAGAPATAEPAEEAAPEQPVPAKVPVVETPKAPVIPAPETDRTLGRDLQSPSPGGAGKPRGIIVDTPDFRLALRGFGQFVVAPYIGKDALLSNGDVGDFAGMRMRRLTLGAEGRARDISFDVWMDLADGPVLTQARLAYTFHQAAAIEAGVVRIPFSKSAIQSSAEVMFTERPLAVEKLVPDRQPGVAVYGAVLDGIASYRAGVFNGAAATRAGLGNDHPGMLVAGRVAVSPLGPLRPGQSDLARGPFRFEVAANMFVDNAAAFTGEAYGLDASAQAFGASVLIEYITQTRTPLVQPIVAPALRESTQRSGMIAQASYLLWKDGVELAVRGERVDDNSNVEDTGDFDALAAGVHWYAVGLDLRLDLDWYHRVETFGPQLENDSLVLSTQGRF